VHYDVIMCLYHSYVCVVRMKLSKNKNG
jgi:hypothetical protein